MSTFDPCDLDQFQYVLGTVCEAVDNHTPAPYTPGEIKSLMTASPVKCAPEAAS